MQLRYDDDFLEACVFVCASGKRRGVPPLQVLRFHRAREKCYAVLDPDERNAAFFRAHLDWFREWGLDEILIGAIERYPLLKQCVTSFAFRQAKGKNEEGAELFVRGDERNAVIAFRPERFADDAALIRFLHRELMHLHDMVDPAFGYSPFVRTAGPSPTQQRIARQRYRLLWEITIDARLSLNDERERHQTLFDRAYSFWTDARRRDVFSELWRNCAPRHDHLLALAADPRDFARAGTAAVLPGSARILPATPLEEHNLPLPQDASAAGAPCPLCGFPTFHWAEPEAFTTNIVATLRQQFPNWQPSEGACSRCIETYQVAGSLEYPPIVLV